MISFKPVGHNGMACEVRSPKGYVLRLHGTLEDVEPQASGDEAMIANPALVHNAWAYAKHEKQRRRLKSPEKRESHRKQAGAHAKTAKAIAELIDMVGESTEEGWCSACYTLSSHRELETGLLNVPAYLCVTCGSPTLGCAYPLCEHMAIRKFGSIRIPRFCAEHRHEIPSFDRASDKVATLDEYEQLMAFDSQNLTVVSRLLLAGMAGAGVVATGGFLAAPAVGGAIGTLVSGYTGAAASTYGLALLGGGAVSAGGLGMVGGTAVIAAAGAALGSALGVNVTSAYISEDKSFRIENFRGGTGTPVIVARGFMTEDDPNWRLAIQMIERRYPESPIYRLHWGSKELASLAAFAVNNVGKKQAVGLVGKFAARATRQGTKLLGAGANAVLIAHGIAKNPWHTAMVRADRTGVALAGILAHTRTENYILVGHSLGARTMITAAETLGTSKDSPSIETLHLLGAAEGRKGDWRPLSEAVSGSVYNYYSTNDSVLKYLFAAAQAGSVALGLRGFATKFPNIKDRDVSSQVDGHSRYFQSVRLV